MKNLVFVLLMVVVMVASAFGTMEDSTTPSIDEGVIGDLPIFQNGTVADAEEINQVVALLRDAIDRNLVSTWKYASNIGAKKTFVHSSSLTTLTSISIGDNIEVHKYSDGSKTEYLTMDSPEGIMRTGRRIYNIHGNLLHELTYFPAVLGMILTAEKEINEVWANAYIAKKSDGRIYGTETNAYIVVGIEDIVVPAGTFPNCVKVFHFNNNSRSMVWLAEGFGVIKKIGNNDVMELQSVE